MVKVACEAYFEILSVFRSMESWWQQLQLLEEFSDVQKDHLMAALNDPTKVREPALYFAAPDRTVERLNVLLHRGRIFMAASFFIAFIVQFILQSSM